MANDRSEGAADRPGAIVVGVDGSERAADALRWAVEEGRLRDRPVAALLAWGTLHQYRADRLEDFDRDYGPDDARAALRAYVIDALGAGAGEAVLLEVARDLPGRALIERSASASLVVVGSRGLGGFAELLLGSVSHQCLQHASSPVAVIRAGTSIRSDAAGARVVVGVDGSESAAHALAWAAEEARRRQARLEIVHAWQVGPVSVDPYGALPVEPGVFEESARATLDEVVARADLDGLGVPAERHLVCSGAARAVLDQAEGADVVVVGTRGMGGFAGLLLGSTSNQVVHHATAPVVVVPVDGG